MARAGKVGDEPSLPKGWRWVRFGDVVRHVKESVDPIQANIERYVAGDHMETDDLHLRRWGNVGDGYLGPAFHRRFVKGQVLYGSRRTYLRKVAVASFDGVCANTTFVLEPATDDLLPELLPFIMQTDAFNQHSVKQSKGSVNPYINWKDLAWYEFALPTRSEQQRIVSLLRAAEQCFHQMNRVRSAVAGLRETWARRLLRLDSFDVVSGFINKDLPKEWRVYRGSDLYTAQSGNGEPGEFDADGNVLFLKVVDFANRSDFMEVVDSQLAFCRNRCPSLRIFEPGTIVFPKRGATIMKNRVGIIRRMAALDPNVMALVPNEDRVVPEYLFWMVSAVGLSRFADTTSLPQLNHKHLMPLCLAVPPLAEQLRIVKRLSLVRETWMNTERHLKLQRLVLGSLSRDLLGAG